MQDRLKIGEMVSKWQSNLAIKEHLERIKRQGSKPIINLMSLISKNTSKVNEQKPKQ